MFRKYGKKIFNVALPLLIIILTLTLSLQEALALKKEYPDKAITMIVGTQPGGLTDLGARVSSDSLSKILGVPIVIVNKPGAGGNAALAAASNAKPDGYTIVTATSAAVIQQVLFPNVPYHITKDFIPICTYASVPKILVVNSNSPFKTIQELLVYAKKNPGKLNCASPGRGTGSHFEMEQFKAQEKVDIMHVPFKSSTEAITALLGNHVDLIFSTLTPVHGMLKAGRLRGLAISMKDKEFLDMPMFTHKSIQGWEGFLVPAKTPQNVHKKLVEAFEKMLKDPGMIPKMQTIGVVPYYLGPDALDQVIKGGLKDISELAEKIGIKPGNN